MVGVMATENFYVGPGASPKIRDLSTADIQIGCRVKCNDSIGTVKYVGNVDGYEGDWIGIDWDDEERGKHAGVVNGVQYFVASRPKSGSFVRRNKLASFQSCADAIKLYYGTKEDSETAAQRMAVINEWKKEIRAPYIEMVGFDKIERKQGNFKNLLEACVHDKCITTAGDLISLCPNLRTLDLSMNLILNWSTVADIARQLSELKDLDLSKNRISLPENEDQTIELRSNFYKLAKLNLSQCLYSWQNILDLAKMWPQIEELVLAFNGISRLAVPSENILDNLIILRLDSNPLSEWSEVLKLGMLPSLKVLSLNECCLENIRFDDRTEYGKVGIFVQLQVLFLNRNRINDWRSLSELDKLPNLRKLYFLKNPIQETVDYDTGCQYVVARIGRLQEYNGSILTRELRRGAEYDYLKKHGLEYKNAQLDETLKAKFSIEHHRFQQLIDKYGLPEDSLLAFKPQSSLLGTKLLEITLKDELSGQTIKNKFPPTATVQRLISLAHRTFKPKDMRRCSLPQLYCLDSTRNNMEICLDNQLKDLSYYSVANRDVILVRWP